MFHLFSHCWGWLQTLQEPVRKMTLLIVGLDNAGKTSLVTEILRVLPCDLLPTMKPNQTELRVNRFEVSLVDLAGGPRFRGTWRNHYSDAHGVIFVLDSSDVARMEEVRRTLSRVLSHPKISGKPLLLLANKQDKVDALLPCELIECLSLEKLVNENKSLCRIEPCSTTRNLHKSQYRATLQGLHWILQTIAVNYSLLSTRVQADFPEQRSPHKQEAPRKTERAHSQAQEERFALQSINILSHCPDYHPTGAAFSFQIREPCSTTRNLHKSQYRATLQGLHWILQTIAVNYSLLSTRVQADFPEQRSPHKQEAPRKTERAHTPLLTRSWTFLHLFSAQKEEGTKVIKKKKVKVKIKKKGLVQSRSTTEEEEGKLEAGENRASAGIGLLHSNRVGQENPSSQETAPPFAGKSTKKKKKKIKNKIKSQQSSLEPWTEDISSTFDLYRRAMLALKMRQEQRKQLAAVTP
ncbi:ADP-ribosylation factor-like protein 13A [Alligator sinensis]|uniref:ADP-ribosylation factor-like protein 13A n=1 Tax=Alligator sinensis TaxID=38654 RepID=A0A3Q0GTZ7_ALLSI|nr:ADP-ribosylation factor-like protein 13A [Alligator sinensis]